MKTLVVEDDESMRELLVTLLQARGHEVDAYADAESALESFGVQRHPLVLLDWMLGGMDGLELCRRMRAFPDGETCVILIVTSRNQPQDLLEALSAGADDYLSKPIAPEILMVRLIIAEQRVRLREERREAQAQLSLTLTQLERSHDDLLAILNLLRVASVITDERGQVSFISHLTRHMFALPARGSIGQPWQQVFPLEPEARSALLAEYERAADNRGSVPIQLRNQRGERFLMEAEVRDDPREPRRRIFLFYDVTEVEELRRQLDGRSRFHDLIGKSEPMQRVYQLIRDVAGVDATVLIEGETGTGKELVARAIHDRSHRKDKPFVPVNCAGLTDSILTSQLFGHKRGAFTGATQDHVGLFEAATGGTLFLDEIGDIPMNVQTAILRVLQEREITRVGDTHPRRIDVRILCATHKDLNEEMAQGRFRSDLLYRIRVARIKLPPLRERQEDLPLLVPVFLGLSRASTRKEVTDVELDAMRCLMEYPWPGNVRELRSAIEFGVIRCKGSTLMLEDLPQELHSATPATPERPLLAGLDERARYLAALRYSDGNRAAAAKLLGISRATFYRHLQRLGLHEEVVSGKAEH